ncbi:conserved Plasmodium protein, unknown function [Plasmodium gallinaceum]|uniref:Uncharacterized protein n=1 Tax=Plasmodium gallinaceum TaxID=5849 RepID=A0A1J1GNY4_PLAGA|nr:conserved Plasmodium protein, unknown function [Plasmodium gallinaceum]CRG94170.1 conserved Plasmodium protein, unknown function [Plasmodium gallinaceum]
MITLKRDLKRKKKYTSKLRKNFLELYADDNERRNKQINFSYYINIESTILELLLDNNLESFKNAGKLLFIILSGVSPNMLYFKRVLNLVYLFFYKGGTKFYHSDMHFQIVVFLHSYIKLYNIICSIYIFNLLLANNNIKNLEKYKDKYIPKHIIATYVDHSYFHIKEFLLTVRKFLIETNKENYQKKKTYLKKLNEKIVLYKESDEEILQNFYKLYNFEFPKSLEKNLKYLISQCTRVNYPLHSIYLDIYILYNIKNILKVLVVIDQLFCSLFPYYYFYELKLKLLLLLIHKYENEKEYLNYNGLETINDKEKMHSYENNANQNKINYIQIYKNPTNINDEENSTLLYEESCIDNKNIDNRNKNKKKKKEINDELNCLYSSDSSKSDNPTFDEETNKKDEDMESDKNFYLDKFMNLYINCTENINKSLPSISELHENNPLKQLNKKIRDKRKKLDNNSILDYFKISEKKSIYIDKEDKESMNNNNENDNNIGVNPVMKKENKRVKLCNPPPIENIYKNTYNDIVYNLNVVVNVAKKLMFSSYYDAIYVKLFYCYLLPFISYEKKIEIFLIYSYSNFKIMKPLTFIIFYNNHNSLYILNTFETIFKDVYLFQKYKNTYFNNFSLKNIPKNYFIFLFFISIFFYNNKIESLLYMYNLFYNYDKEIISNKEKDINYTKIYEEVILKNDEKYVEQKKHINIIIIKFIETYKEKFNIYLCEYFDFYRIFFILFVSCVDVE